MTTGAPRVLIIVENLPVPFDRRVWNIATTLAGTGHPVSVICPKGPGAEAAFETLEDVHIHRHGLPLEAKGRFAFLLEYAWALLAETWLAWRVLLTGRGFDIVHICNPPDLLFLVALPFKLLGKRVVFDHHDLCPELYEAKFQRRDWLWRVMLGLERATFRTADMVISTNASYAAVARGRGRVPADRVHVVRSGPDLRRLRRRPPDPALKRGKAHLVGYVGVMGDQEGLEPFLDIVRDIVRARGRDDVHFAFVGGGPALDRLRARATALGLDDAVTFTGRAPEETLLAVLNTADICVNADEPNPLNDKSTMNKIMEYMALGKPIVQYDLTEGRVSAEDASLYARPGDKAHFADLILGLLDDPARREAMGRIGRERVETRLAWTLEAPKLLAA